MTNELRSLALLEPAERLRQARPTDCQPLLEARDAIALAMRRFHESWLPHRTITPTLYAIGPVRPGAYLTLGRLRYTFGVRRETVDALLEALEADRPLTGHLLAVPGVSADPPRPLFCLDGHEYGELHHGALDLSNLTPYAGTWRTELDMTASEWTATWSEALASLPHG